ncbi:neurofilament medium polypeptide-like [Neodiprion pinetum]|uniref:neurofilament medium polypeptide-like n=1 Tax=Neodiprion pinetum TaxID=441929 RepID=UPI001EDCC161|nr:uncharacterized protein LOC124217603 [Neodiprion pinetum]
MNFKIILFLAAIVVVSYAEVEEARESRDVQTEKLDYIASPDAALYRKLSGFPMRRKRYWFPSVYDEEEVAKPSDTDKKLEAIIKSLEELIKQLQVKNSAPQNAQPYVYYPVPTRPGTGPSSGPTAHSAPVTPAPSRAFTPPEVSSIPESTVHTIKVEVVPCAKCFPQEEPSKKNPEAESEKRVTPAKPSKSDRDAETPVLNEEKPANSKEGSKDDRDTPKEPQPMKLPEFPDEKDSKDSDVTADTSV